MESETPALRNKLKQRFRMLVTTGASTVVLATTILSAIPADANVADTNPADTLQNRVEKVRPQAQDANAHLQQWRRFEDPAGVVAQLAQRWMARMGLAELAQLAQLGQLVEF